MTDSGVGGVSGNGENITASVVMDEAQSSDHEATFHSAMSFDYFLDEASKSTDTVDLNNNMNTPLSMSFEGSKRVSYTTSIDTVPDVNMSFKSNSGTTSIHIAPSMAVPSNTGRSKSLKSLMDLDSFYDPKIKNQTKPSHLLYPQVQTQQLSQTDSDIHHKNGKRLTIDTGKEMENQYQRQEYDILTPEDKPQGGFNLRSEFETKVIEEVLLTPKDKEVDTSQRKISQSGADKAQDSEVVKDSPSTKQNIKRPTSIKDDFFSLAYDEPAKKKRKKKQKKKRRKEDDLASDSAPGESVEVDDFVLHSSKSPVIESDMPVSQNERSSTSKPKKLVRSITPPPVVNTEALTNKILEEKKKLDLQNGSRPVLIDDDDPLLNLEIHNPVLSSQTRPITPLINEDFERTRVYILKVISKLPSTDDTSIELSVKGTKKFSKIIESSLQYLITNSPMIGQLGVLGFYKPESVSLVWVEGKIEIKPFFKPSTLNIKSPIIRDEPTFLTCLLIPGHNKENWQIYPELRDSRREASLPLAPPSPKFETEVLNQEEPEIIYSDDEDQQASTAQQNSNSKVLVESSDGYFVVGLKGKDNKKITVKVNSNTQLIKLAQYFLDFKKLDPKTKVKLIFDDEEMDLSQKVGDTELEEDFEIDVRTF